MRRAEASDFLLLGTISSSAIRLIIQGDYLYASYSSSVNIIDISNPNNPVLVSSCPTDSV